MGNEHLNWAILLIAIALVLFFVEFLVPSGGILAISAFLSLAAGVFFLYKVNTTVGLIGAIISVGALPFLFALGLKIFPNTPVYRMLMLKSSDARPGLGEHGIAGAAGREAMKSLIGRQGKAVTDLRPIGTCLIDGERIDCLATAGPIRAGTLVKVVAADGLQVKVKEDES